MNEELNATTDAAARAPVRIAIADDRRLVADALAALIRTMDGFELVDVFYGEEELPAIVARDPGVLLVATGANPSGGFKLVRALRQVGLRVDIVLLADVLSAELVRFVLEQRLSGLILTDTPASGLAACLGRVASGHAVLPADWQTVLATQGDDPVGSLSDRQLEVLSLVAEGYSYEEIGRRLFISANTVKFHLRSIYMRLGVRNRVAAARMLSERGGPEGHPAYIVGPGPRSDTQSREKEPRRAD
ncbi:MAG: response regulator transcription factor [Solirubrobacterales bacterium]|nr:response regulator transcription factor [Solirubrobacterales bacterium]